jgi:uncharacterized protein YwgA
VERRDYVLAVLAAARGSFTPVQLQKLFFILDKKAATQLGGPYFGFEPYDYGPFDAEVYREVSALAEQGFASVQYGGTLRRYGIAEGGNDAGEAALAGWSREMRTYIHDLAKYVRSMSFADLVSAVYKEWPEMRAKSIFRG